MELIDIVPSIDNVSEKYVFKTQKGYMEFTKIFNEDPPLRTIICAPSSYGCGLGCTFCHLTIAGSKSNIPVSFDELETALNQIKRDKSIPLLVSLMGAGEPLLNLKLVEEVSDCYPTSIATSMPTEISVQRFVDYIRKNPTKPIKVYASVHSFIPENRAKLMPNSIGNLFEMLELLTTMPRLRNMNGHKEKDAARLVVHYTVIPGVNDSLDDFLAMVETLKRLQDAPKIKFLAWSDGDNSVRSRAWMDILHNLGFKAKYHAPNANDIGGACGQFNPQYYAPQYTVHRIAELRNQ